MKFTRGFTGRGKADARSPAPTRPVRHRAAVAGARGRGHAEDRPRHLDLHRRGPGRAADHVDVGRDARAPAVDVRGRHPLRHHLVEARAWSSRACRSTRCSRSPARCPTPRHVLAFSSTGYTTNLPLADVTDGKAWVAFRADGSPLSARPRRARPPPRAPPLLLEERQVGRRGCGSSTTTSPGSGSRTATTTAAIPGSSSATRATDRARGLAVRPPSWPSATRRRPRRRSGCASTRPRGTAPVSTTSCGSPRPTATPRRARTRSRRHPTAATRSSSRSSGSTTARCRRSSTTSSRSATSSRCAARSAATSCGTAPRPRCCSAAAPASCRSWRCCGCAPRATGARRPRAPRRVGAHARRPLLRRRAPATATTPPCSTHAPTPPRRPRPAGRLTADDVLPHLRDDAIDLRVRLGAVHRRGRRPARRPRRRAERVKVERFGPSA